MKRLTTRLNDLGIGIDVGWVFPPNEIDPPHADSVESWWGNTRDVNTLAQLVDDLYFQGYEFQLDSFTIALLSTPERQWPCVAFAEGLV
jgi:hypothetical protein